MVKLPNRNKSKDNPYTLDFDENNNSYIIEFKDNKQVVHKVKITEKVYQAFDTFELEDISQIHKYRNHIEHSELFEETLNKRILKKPISVEEEVENKIIFEEVKKAIDRLSNIQKRRIKLYYFENMSLEEIAKLEGTTHQAISKSIRKGIEELKKILKN